LETIGAGTGKFEGIHEDTAVNAIDCVLDPVAGALGAVSPSVGLLRFSARVCG